MRRSILLTLFLATAGPASADWLVGLDGTRVETRGPWKVKGSAVVFTLPNGTLSSMRLSAVDTEASTRAGAETRIEPRVPAGEVRRTRPVWVLTNENVPRAAEALEMENGEGGGEAGTEAEDATPPDEPGPIEVISWSEEDSPETGRLEISGVLRNLSMSIVTDIGVEVSLLDHEGRVVARSEAFLDAVSMAARSTTSFRALLPVVDSFENAPRFTVRSRALHFEVAEESVGKARESS